MSKECKHEEWNPCGNDFYSCRKCGILRTSQQVNLYAEKDRYIDDLEAKLSENEEIIKYLKEIKRYDIGEMLTENTKLKQQLTEKEETINNLEQQCLICNKDQENERLKQQLAEKDKEIAFLKGFKDAITSTIDNQIKQLKEMPNEK